MDVPNYIQGTLSETLYQDSINYSLDVVRGCKGLPSFETLSHPLSYISASPQSFR